MASASYTDDDIRQQVRICLMKIKKDDAFMESHLHASDYDEIDRNALDTSKYDLFLNYVAMAMTNKRQRKADKFKEERLVKTDVVQVAIDGFDPDVYVLENPPVLGATKRSSAPQKLIQVAKMNLEVAEEEVEPGEKKTEKKKRRRSKSTTQTEAKGSKKSRVKLKFSENEKQKIARDSKREYLSEKEDLLERIPEEYSKHIGKIVFGKWRKDPHRPVLLAGPYQVPPGNFRETWIKMFENVKGDTSRMWYWCYWYGSPLSEAYTQQKLKEFVSFDNAVKRKVNTLPPKIAEKVEKGKKLTKIEDQVLRGFEGLDDQVKKAPEDRRGEAFCEDHEAILNLADDISLHEESFDEDGEEMVETVDSPPAKKTKKTLKKPSVQKPPKEPPKKKKVQPIAGDFINDIGEQEVSNNDSDNESGDEKDNDFDKEEEVEDDDLDDLDFQEGAKKLKPLKKKKKHPSAVKEEVSKPKKKKKVEKPPLPPEDKAPPPQDEDPAEERLAKRRAKDRLRKRKQKEAKVFERCVVDYKGVVDDLRDAIKNVDAAKIVGCMKEIKEKVNSFSAPFIEKYDFALLMKSAKTHLTSDEDRRVRKELLEELKAIHKEKKTSVPKGWEEYLKSGKVEPKEGKSEGTKKLKKKKDDVETRAAHENSSDNGAKVKKDPASEKVPSLDNSRHGGNRQSSDGQEKATEISTKRERDEVTGSAHGSTQLRVELSSSSVPPKMVDMKGEESSGLQVSNKYRADSSHPSMKAPKRKSSLTSLMSLLNKDIKTPKVKSEDAAAARKSLEPIVSTKKLPEWLTAELAIDSAVELNECRSLGLEFFLEVSEYFPSSVNRTSMARALEGAAYTWATERKTSKPSWEGGYWEKLHTVVGSIGGKHRAGSILAAIVDGKYPSAKSIIDVSDEVLMESFEGGQNGCY